MLLVVVLVDLGAVPPLGDRPRRLCGRLVGGRGLHVGRADPPRQVRRLHAVGPARRDRRAVPHLLHLYGRGVGRQRQHLHAVLDRRRRARRRLAVRRLGQRHRRDLRRARRSAPSATCCSCSTSIRCGSRCSRASCCCWRSASARSAVPRPQPAGAGSDDADGDQRRDRPAAAGLRRASTRRSRRPSAASSLLLLLGSLYSTQLPVARISAAAAQGRVVPRRHRHRHDARHPARPDRPVGAVGGGGRRHDGVRRRPAGAARRGACDPVRHRSAASRSASSTASASPICASLDDHHARHQRGRAGPDGGPHRRLLAAGFIARAAMRFSPPASASSASRTRVARLGGRSARPRSSC